MPAAPHHPFALEAHPAKADPDLLDADVRHFARIEARLQQQTDDVRARLADLRRAPGGSGTVALDRDLEIHRLTGRLRLLQRYGLDLCLGRIVSDEQTWYIGRLALADADDELLLIDWRAPAAEPFFAATHARPMNLLSRRRYRWTDGRITDFWDEAFTDETLAHPAALDDQSAFIASLGASRSPRMRDVLGTIQADQDAIIREGSNGALVVDGGPGTGKTVVALHRAAYLLYADPRLQRHRGGVLFVGPSHAYTDYVMDILPGLGDDGVQTCTLADLVVEGAAAAPGGDAEVARVKADGRMPGAVDTAVQLLERPPSTRVRVETAWADVDVTPADWAEAFGAADPAANHNDAREEIWAALLNILVDRLDPDQTDDPWADDEEQFDAYRLDDPDESPDAMRRGLAESDQLRSAFDDAWPLLDPPTVVQGLLSTPALLRRCAPWLSDDDIAVLTGSASDGWTTADLPLLDAARSRVGDPEAAARRRRADKTAAAERARMDEVINHLIDTDDSEMRVMSMLRGQDLRGALAAEPARTPAADALAGPFAHIIVDEAQELTDAEWQMLVRRNPSGSFTVVGDRAQARHGFGESWTERLTRVGLRQVHLSSLSVNYRTPVEIMDEAAPVIRALLPDANVPTSIRSTGVPVRYARISERDDILRSWLEAHAEGVACVIGDESFPPGDRVRSLSPVAAKGLEFDLVLLADPDRSGSTEATVDRYVAMTRATRELVILDG